MTKKNKTVFGALLTTALIGGLVASGGEVIAADHIDGPDITNDPAADITDFYAWADGDSVYLILAFAGLSEAGTPALYDPDVLYGIHVDNDGDGVSDRDIWIRFGQSDDGEWGVQVEGLAGDGAVVGPVEETIDAPLGQKVFAGLRDDGFFFDFQGFQTTLMTGDLSFDADRDFFAGVNVTAVAIEASLDAVASGGEPFTIWATTRR
ncbi:MAG: DUF4331 family protein [Nannocystaceae bacterium]|nr:DUF4331 family protein [Nannocystaceae bacterium]